MLIYLWRDFCFLFYLIFIDNGIYMTEQFVQTVSSVNYNKGIFSLYFVGQDPLKMAQGVMAESDNELALKQTVHMPAAGFMYMVSMIKNMLEDPRMAAEFDKMIAAGLIPAAPADAQESTPAATAQAAPRKKK
ncbi:TPA: peptide chain release factor 1 [Aeromonas dhakensis]|nr:peptide chain release factor 1 [Aeromonas dhakensis]